MKNKNQIFKLNIVNVIISMVIVILTFSPSIAESKNIIQPICLTFEQCKKIKLKNNYDYRIAKQELKVARNTRKEAIRNLFPTISINYEESTGKINKDYIKQSYGITLNQTLFQGGKLYNTYLKASAEYNAANENIEKILQETSLRIEDVFYNCLKLQKTFEDYEDICSTISNILNNLEEKNKADLISNIDYLEAKNLAQEILLEKSFTKQNLEVSLIVLKQELDIDNKKTVLIDGTFNFEEIEFDIDDIILNLEVNNPHIKIEREKLKAEEHGKKVAKADFLPIVDFESYYNKMDDKERRSLLSLEKDWYAGLKVTLPFFGNSIKYEHSKLVSPGSDAAKSENKRRDSDKISFNILDRMNTYTEKDQAKTEYRKQLKDYNDTRKKYFLEARKTYLNLKQSRITAINNLEKEKIYREKAKLIEFKVKNNTIPPSELLKVYKELLVIVKEYRNALFDYHIAVKKLKTFGSTKVLR